MRSFRLAAALAASMSLAALIGGCENKFATITPDVQTGMMSDLQAGKLNLDCGLKCDFTWIAQTQQIHALDIAERWNDLAVRVMQIGYGNDLAYYYLGQAAQGLGYHQAAITYYTQSLALSTGPNPLLKCENATGQGDNCQGVDIVSSIPVLIQASRDALAQQAQAANSETAPVVHHTHHKPKPASQWVAPPPDNAASQPATGSGTAGWVAPPPAQQ